MKKVLITGTFDILHPGHLFMLRQAKQKGGMLSVVIARDTTVKKVKDYEPYFNEKERAKNLRGKDMVDEIILGSAGDKLKVIERVKPDVICLGYDQRAFTKDLEQQLRERGLHPRITRLRAHKSKQYKTARLHQNDLVRVTNAIPTIISEPRYATKRNVLGRPFYYNKIILVRRPLIKRLRQAQQTLEKNNLRLKILDAYRPLSVQRTMWRQTSNEQFVADPTKEPHHPRAAAVDCTLVDEHGRQLRMPTPFDEFSPRAFRSSDQHRPEAHKNMLTMEQAMADAGFIPAPTEWWHFTDPDWKRYPILDIPI